jgi:hypothetical protein
VEDLRVIAPKRSIADLQKDAREAVRNTLLLHPKLPAANLIEHVIEQAGNDLVADIDAALHTRYFLNLIRLERADNRQQAQATEWLFPEIREQALVLPANIPIGDGKKVARNDLHFSDTARYLKLLDQDDRDRKKKDPRRAAIKRIRRMWPRSKKARRDMTLAEVDALKAKRAGIRA